MSSQPGVHKLAHIRLRDSCILPDPEQGIYYLCSAVRPSEGYAHHGVGVYTSRDLENWQGPTVVFDTPEDFWAQEGIWAPELHAYRNRYYLFLTFNTNDLWSDQWDNWRPRVNRGSQVLVSDSPLGPFQPFRNTAHLPVDQMTLDGTLWVEDGVPYMVYCHEWVEIIDGTFEAIRLEDDLSATFGEPMVLFHGSDAPWKGNAVKEHPAVFVTDGPYLYTTRTGHLLMVWSSFGAGGYTTGVAHSLSDRLAGPWVQQEEPLYTNDGGHAMIFRRFDGQLMLTLHQPNNPPNERGRLFELEDTGETIRIVRRLK